MKKNKGFTLIELLIVIAIIGILFFVIVSDSNAGWFTSSKPAEVKTTEEIQKNLLTAVPIPSLTNSLERENVAKRAEIFNTPNKISYIYLVNYGKVMAFYTVKGKVSSLQSYMVATEKLIDTSGAPCTYDSSESFCYTVAAPDIDGTYGENVEGIFFFTTEGAYVEWKGEYMMSDQPLKLSTPPALYREVK